MWERVGQVREVAAGLAQAPAWSLSDDDLAACLDELYAAEQVVAAAQLHLVAEVDGRGLPARQGVRSMSRWLRGRLHVAAATAAQWVELAGHVRRRPGLDTALTDGAVNTDQAKVIGTAVAALPARLGGEVVDKAEAALLEYAGDFEPQALGKLGRRILWHVAPEVAEQADAQALRREEERAHISRAFTLTPTGDGRTRLTGWLDAEAAATVNAALDPLCNPRRGDPADTRTPTQRRADALLEICQLALRTDTLPDHGGQRPQLVVTVPFDVLTGQLGAGMLDTGEPISAAQVRRLACDAQVLPAVLGGDGQVLDLGQARRLFTGAVRRALVLRDGGCAYPGCDRPARWAEGHHIIPWAEGGPTSLDNGCLLCGHHHRAVHRDRWQIRLGHDRRPELIPPAHVDPERRPRRNIYHRRP